MNAIDMKIKQQEIAINEAKTNHVLHLILSLLTGGIWFIVWIIIGVINSNKREAAMDNIQTLMSDDARYKYEPKQEGV